MPVAENRLRFLNPNQSNPDKPLFVFLPGMDGTGRSLATQLPRLERFFDVRCLSIPSDDLNGWSGLVEQTAALIQTEQDKGQFRQTYICGESFGGCLALKLAAYSRDLFDRLILINPASSFARRPIMGLGSGVINLLPESLYQISAVGLLPFLVDSQRVSSQNRDKLLTAMRSVASESAALRISLLNRFSLGDIPLHKISQPVLVVASELDRLLPSTAEAARLVRNLPNAQKIKLPKSGHVCLLEEDFKLDQILDRCGFLPTNQKTDSSSDKKSRNIAVN